MKKILNLLLIGDGPLKLVYTSLSYTEEKVGPMIGVFIYEVNKDYKPIS